MELMRNLHNETEAKSNAGLRIYVLTGVWGFYLCQVVWNAELRVPASQMRQTN